MISSSCSIEWVIQRVSSIYASTEVEVCVDLYLGGKILVIQDVESVYPGNLVKI